MIFFDLHKPLQKMTHYAGNNRNIINRKQKKCLTKGFFCGYNRDVKNGEMCPLWVSSF